MSSLVRYGVPGSRVSGPGSASRILNVTTAAAVSSGTITKVGSTTNTGTLVQASSRAPAVPTGAAVGDVAFVHLDLWDSSLDPAVTTPSGFTQLYKATASGGQAKTYVFWKRLTAADTGTYTFSWTGSPYSAAIVTMLRGVKASGDPVGANYNTTTATSANFPSTTVNPSYVPALLWHGYSDSPATHTPPTSPVGFVETADYDCGVNADYFPTSGTSFTVTGATTTVSSPLLSSLIAVEPEPTSGAITLVVDNAGQSQTAGNVVLTLGGIDIVVAAAAQAQVADSPTLTQVHNLTVQNATHTQTAQTVAFTPYATAASGNGRYIVDQNGEPYLGLFDTIWPMVQQAGRDSAGDWQDDMDHWIDTRSSQGFNGLKFNLFGNVISGANADLLTDDNVSPFNTTNPATADPTQFNETYWTRVDYLIDQAAAAGMTCWIHVAYKDDVSAPSGTGWMQGHSNAEYTSFGTLLGNRYKNRPNIVWVYGGDYFDESAAQLELVADAITTAGDTHLVTVQNYADSSGATYYTTSRKHSSGTTLTLGSAVATLDGLYVYGSLFAAAEQAYNTSPALPLVYYDGYYDGGDNLRLRRDMGWSLTCGTYSSHYGSESLWSQPVGWRSNLTAESQLVNMLDVIAGLADWETLVPDFSDAFITSGKGSGTSTVTAAKTAGGTLAVVYNPVASNTVTLATASMVAGYTAKWVDPANGAVVSATPGTTFTRATSNSAGSTDWFLILEAPTGITLTVQDAAQAQTAASPALTQTHALAVDSATQAQSADNVTITQAHTLVVQSATQTPVSDSPTLTQVHVLVVDAAAQSQSADSPALTQAHSLVAQDATQAQTAGNVVLVVGWIDLVVASATQAQSADNVTLTQVHALTVQDATQAQSAESATLAQSHLLAVQAATQAQVSDSPALTQAHSLTVDNAAQAQTSDNVTATQVHLLAVDAAAQAQTASNLTLAVGGITLVVSDTTQAQTATSVTLTQVHALVVDSATQPQTVDTVALTQTSNLVVQGATQAQTAEAVTLTVAGISLVVDDASQVQTASVVALVQVHQLVIADAFQSQTADHVLLVQAHSLEVQGAAQAQIVDSVTLVDLGVGRNLTITPGLSTPRAWATTGTGQRWATADTERRWS
jgi:hypothetical protein